MAQGNERAYAPSTKQIVQYFHKLLFYIYLYNILLVASSGNKRMTVVNRQGGEALFQRVRPQFRPFPDDSCRPHFLER